MILAVTDPFWQNRPSFPFPLSGLRRLGHGRIYDLEFGGQVMGFGVQKSSVGSGGEASTGVLETKLKNFCKYIV